MSVVRIRIDGEGPFPSRFAEGPLGGPWGLWRLVGIDRHSLCIPETLIYRYELGARTIAYDDAVRWVQDGWKGVCEARDKKEGE